MVSEVMETMAFVEGKDEGGVVLEKEKNRMLLLTRVWQENLMANFYHPLEYEKAKKKIQTTWNVIWINK